MRIAYVVSRPLEINTSSSIRNRATIEGLLQMGHNVDLVTTQPDKNHANYDNSVLNKNIRISYLKLGGIQNVSKVARKFKIVKPFRNIVYGFMSKFDIYDNLKGIVNYSLKIGITDDKYDLIISSSDPKSSHLFISKMYEKQVLKNTPWIQIWGDPFLSDITRKNKLLDSKIKKEENRLLKHATKVIYVSNLTLKEQQEIYPEYANKMFYQPIPYVKKEVYPSIDLKKQCLTFLYCGDYSSKIRNIKPLYDAIKKTNHNLIVCGSSDVKLESTERIKIYPRVSFEKTKEFESKCDVLVHLSNLKGTQVPGKIYQYSGTNKLILFILDGETQALSETFRKYERYIFCQNNRDDIRREVEKINKGIYVNTKFVVDDFEPKKVANRIIKI